jgi:hypothetical protein
METSMNRPPGTLVLLRHAQSLWNLENRFSGWADMDLSAGGIAEAHRAGRLLRDQGLRFDRAFVSPLKRATRTLDVVLAELDQGELPVIVDWHLNERHYGALQGLNNDGKPVVINLVSLGRGNDVMPEFVGNDAAGNAKRNASPVRARVFKRPVLAVRIHAQQGGCQ